MRFGNNPSKAASPAPPPLMEHTRRTICWPCSSGWLLILRRVLPKQEGVALEEELEAAEARVRALRQQLDA